LNQPSVPRRAGAMIGVMAPFGAPDGALKTID